jgi:hypothetical protein
MVVYYEIFGVRKEARILSLCPLGFFDCASDFCLNVFLVFPFFVLGYDLIFLEFGSDFFGVASPFIARIEDERRVVLVVPNGSATNAERPSTVCAHLSGARRGPP